MITPVEHGRHHAAVRGVPLRVALAGLRHVSREEWALTGPVARWLLLSRAPVLTITLASWALGVLFAAHDGALRWDVAGLTGLGLLLAHAASGQLNDYVDSVRGVDRDNPYRTRYGVHAVEHGLMSPRVLLRVALGTGLAALAAGIAVAALAGPVVLLPLAIGAVLLFAYSVPLKRMGLAELAVWLTWGPLMVGGTYLALTGRVDGSVLLASLVTGLGPTLVVLGKHVDKWESDAALGLRSIPVRLGESPVRLVMQLLLWCQPVLHIVLVAGEHVPWPTLLALLAVPRGLVLHEVLNGPKPSAPPPWWPDGGWPLWFVAHAFVYARLQGSLFLLGLFLALFLP